ncbi:hypothetical protein F5X96DRAFT_615557 [Biscogniauxia mediterranea]|nr:hypothetical protein F5X96DRAFT_615557 [Biscogniauxia mediterranea]
MSRLLCLVVLSLSRVFAFMFLSLRLFTFPSLLIPPLPWLIYLNYPNPSPKPNNNKGGTCMMLACACRAGDLFYFIFPPNNKKTTTTSQDEQHDNTPMQPPTTLESGRHVV